jgi:hypothetical protein
MKTNTLSSDIEDLRRVRDELKVQLHLAKAEARDAFDRLEKKWPDIDRGFIGLERAADTAKNDISRALRELLKELRDGYAALKPHTH